MSSENEMNRLLDFLGYSILLGTIAGLLASIGDLYLGILFGILSINTYLAIVIAYVLFFMLISIIVNLITIVTSRPEKRRVNFNKLYFIVTLYLIDFVYVNGKLNGWFNFLNLRAAVLNSILLAGVISLFFILQKSKRFEKLFLEKLEFLTVLLMLFASMAFFNYYILNWSSPLQNKMQVIMLLFIILAIPYIILFIIDILYSFCASWLKSERNIKLLSISILLLFILSIPLVFKNSCLTFYKIEDYHAEQSKLEQLKGKPNIIWIVLDTVRKDHLSCYGHRRRTTPNIEKFSKDGMLFTNYISTAPWTLPSHASMLTGLYSSEHGAHIVDTDEDYVTSPLDDKNLTIAEILKEHGYNTAAFISNFGTINRAHNFEQGFNFFCDGRSYFYSSFWGLLAFNVNFLQNFKDNPIFRINKYRLSPEINKTILIWLKKNRTSPFFLFINYMEAHSGTNYLPKPYSSLYDFSWQKWLNGSSGNTAEKQKIKFDWYDCRITYLDHHIGQLFTKLKELNLYDNAIIVVVADHGELFGEHGSYGHVTDLYNELINVPLIVKYPNYLNKQGVENKYVQTVDIMPEILFTLEMTLPEGISGQPFNKVDHQIIAELFKNKKIAHKDFKRYYRDLKAIFSLDSSAFKYIKSSNERNELYNLLIDPHETNNIINSKEKIVRDLDSKLIDWISSLRHLKKRTNKNKKISSELKKNLKALGYIK
ncbi:MAG: sulfatase-like hydrolase/transferase [Calditrichaeota bacterium]|nr:sulfatase-like hydrolase/transferase [Calditrichota bacterium]